MSEAKTKLLQKLTYICLSLSSIALFPEAQVEEISCGYLSTGKVILALAERMRQLFKGRKDQKNISEAL